jgi:hypothetical protein
MKVVGSITAKKYRRHGAYHREHVEYWGGNASAEVVAGGSQFSAEVQIFSPATST